MNENEQIELKPNECFLLLITQKQKHPESKGGNFEKGLIESEPTQGSELKLMNKRTTRTKESHFMQSK